MAEESKGLANLVELEEIETFSTVSFEIGDVLDLHSFPPSEIGELVHDYLDLAYARGLRRLRIIHGKGVGVQKERVRQILEKDPRVIRYGDPPGEAGGWGATWVEMG